MSASLTVDLGKTCISIPSVSTNQTSGLMVSVSGAIVGNIVDLRDGDTYCNVAIDGWVATSGQLRIAVQTSTGTTSGGFTDPTSGIPLLDLPTPFQSGGILWINSGGVFNGIFGSGVSGENVASGFQAIAAFQRVGRYARAIVLSGETFNGILGSVTFITNRRTTGSGGGFSFQPGSGNINV